MKDLSSFAHDSILNDSRKAGKWFSWETIRLGFESKLPTLMALLSAPLLSFVASLLLKCKSNLSNALCTAKQVGTLYEPVKAKTYSRMNSQCFN